MTIEQTVEIPANHRLVLDLPREIPQGKARFTATVTPVAEPPAAPSGLTLSERFAGALRLSGAKYESLQNALRQSRDEWNRNIF